MNTTDYLDDLDEVMDGCEGFGYSDALYYEVKELESSVIGLCQLLDEANEKIDQLQAELREARELYYDCCG